MAWSKQCFSSSNGGSFHSYPLVNVYITMENHHFYFMGKSTINIYKRQFSNYDHGKTHYRQPFSIAMLVYPRISRKQPISAATQGDDDSLTQDFLRFLAQADRSESPEAVSCRQKNVTGYRNELINGNMMCMIYVYIVYTVYQVFIYVMLHINIYYIFNCLYIYTCISSLSLCFSIFYMLEYVYDEKYVLYYLLQSHLH